MALRAARGAITFLGAMAALAAPAHASFHREKVNEVMLASAGGDTSVQFVELLDQGGIGEQFPAFYGPYKLVIYDAAGNELGEHQLDANGLRAAAASGSEYLISTAAADAAFGVKGDETLDVALPTTAGQACYQANQMPPAFSCLTWGTITGPVGTNVGGTGSAHGPLPANGESDQRQPDDSVIAAAPTPKAPNAMPPGGQGGGGAGGGGGGGGGGTTPAFAGTTVRSHKVHVDRRGRAPLRLTCPAGTDGSCTGTATLNRKRKRIGRAHFEIAAGRTATVRVKLVRSTLRLLNRRGRLHVALRVVARDAAGSSKVSSASLTLLRRR